MVINNLDPFVWLDLVSFEKVTGADTGARGGGKGGFPPPFGNDFKKFIIIDSFRLHVDIQWNLYNQDTIGTKRKCPD